MQFAKSVKDKGYNLKVGIVNVGVEKGLSRRLLVRGLPTVRLFRDGLMYEFKSHRTVEGLTKFFTKTFSTIKGSKIPEPLPVHHSQVKEDPNAAVANSKVTILTGKTFDQSIKTGMWLVQFSQPWCGHCKQLAPTWVQLAESESKATGATHIAKVDCSEAKAICEKQEIKGFPTIKLFKDGAIFKDYKGSRTLTSFQQFIKQSLSEVIDEPPSATGSSEQEPQVASPATKSSKNAQSVVVLDSQNFNDKIKQGLWMIEFYAPWCGHCKNFWLPFGTILEIKPKLYQEFKSVKLTVKPMRLFVKKYGVSSYPTIKLFKETKRLPVRR